MQKYFFMAFSKTFNYIFQKHLTLVNEKTKMHTTLKTAFIKINQQTRAKHQWLHQ